MRYSLEYPVISHMLIEQDLELEWYGRRLILRRDERGLLSRIYIEAKVPETTLVRHSLTFKAPGQPALSSSGDEVLHRHLERDLQTIESSFGYHFDLERIVWEDCTSNAVPETPQEEANVQYSNFSLKIGGPRAVAQVANEDLVKALERGHICRDLTDCMAFLREGQNDYHTQRYITAFFSFFFVLEGLYAKGKSNKHLVIANFLASPNLVMATQGVLNNSIPKPSFTDVYTIDKLLQRFGKSRDVPGALAMLVYMRGDLHHFTNTKAKQSGTPFTHKRYQHLALFTMIVCRIAIEIEIGARRRQQQATPRT